MFSCSACDEWRTRLVHGTRRMEGITQADFRTERFRCQRAKRGKKPIRFRVIVGHNPGITGVDVEASDVVNEEPAAKVMPPKERVVEQRAAAKAEANRKKDAEAAAVRARLMNNARVCKEIVEKKKKEDDIVVMKAVEAFNRSTILKLTLNLQGALVEKSKFLAMEAQLKISEQLRMKAEEALNEEKQITKNLRNQILYNDFEECEDVAGFPHNLARAMGSYSKSIRLRTV
jgi:hypothetical protein